MNRNLEVNAFAIAAISFAAVFGLVAVGALVWAISEGQFRDFAKGAESIFDEDEPIGVPTDGFPGEASTAGQLKEPREGDE